MNWFVFFILSIFMTFTPYQRGLFFDTDVYSWEVIIGIVFLVYGTWMLIKQRKFPWIYLVVFLLPLMYFISLFVAETPKGAYDQLFRWVLYASFFLMLIGVRNNEKINKAMPVVFQVTGIIIVSLALAGYWGWFQFQDLIWSDRLTGTFQYPNTFGTLMGAFWVYSLIALTKRSSKTWEIVLLSLPLVAYLSTLLLSESRGTFLALPVAWFIGLVLLNTKRQVLFILNTLISSGLALVVYRKFDVLKKAGASHPGFIYFIVGTILCIGLIILVNYLLRGDKLELLLQKSNKFRYIIPVVMVVFAGLFTLDLINQGQVYRHLPVSLQERISSINTGTYSVVGRTNFYEDGLKMIKEAPIIGMGGNGWRVLFPKYESQPYWSTQTHNGYLETLLNTGWLGLIVFVSIFAFLFVQIGRKIWAEKGLDNQVLNTATIPPLAVLFIHAFIDFDFSYGTVWLIAFWLFSMGVKDKTATLEDEFSIPWVGKTVLSVVIIFAIVLSFKSFKFMLSEQNYSAAQNAKLSQEAQQGYEKAIVYNPYDVDKLLGATGFYRQVYLQSKLDTVKQRIQFFDQNLMELEPNNSNVLLGIANDNFVIGEPYKSVEFINKAIQVDPYNVKLYDNSVYYKSTLALQLLNTDKSKALEMAKNSIIDYQNFIKASAQYKAKPIPNMRPLDFAKTTYLYVGQSQMLTGEYQHAIDVLGNITAKDDKQLYKEASAAKLIALDQLGKNNEAKKIEQEVSNQFDDFGPFLDSYRKQMNLK